MSKPFICYLLMAGSLLLTGCSNGQALSPSIHSTHSASTIKIGGSAETYDVLENLIEAYQTEYPDSQFEFFPPSQTSGGIQGVKSAVIDIGGVGRIPTADETHDQVIYFRLAKAPLVVVVHKSVTGINNITGDQIKSIYSGQITNWKELGGPDADIVLFDLTEDESEKQTLRQLYLGQDLAITPNAIVFPEDDDVPETAAITEFSMATIAYEDTIERLDLNPLRIEGVHPSAQAIQSGAYPMVLTLGIVLDQQPSNATQEFLKFAIGPKGQKTLSGTNYIPLDID